MDFETRVHDVYVPVVLYTVEHNVSTIDHFYQLVVIANIKLYGLETEFVSNILCLRKIIIRYHDLLFARTQLSVTKVRTTDIALQSCS